MTGRRKMRFLVVGAGMSGILAAVRLREAGHQDVTVLGGADRRRGTRRTGAHPAPDRRATRFD